MISHEWHLDGDDLAAYASGRTGPVMLSSIESHLIACEACRDALSGHVHRDAAGQADGDDPVWASIVDRVDRGNRVLARSTRLLHVSVSSPPLAMVTAFLAGLLIAFVGVAGAIESRDATIMLISVGPLIPLIGARVAFG